MAAYSLWLAGRNARRRMEALMLLVGLLIVGGHPARAAVDFCSADPVITFEHDGVVTTWVMDLQVMIPLSQLPLSGPAVLDVKVPKNVNGLVVNPTLPPFRVDVQVRRDAPQATSGTYPVTLTLRVPASQQSFPIALLITDPLSANIKMVEGVAGKPLLVSLTIR